MASLVTTNEQVQEVWTGTTFGAAALMLTEGLKDEAYKTAWGVYHTTYETEGYWFRTPEAWDKTGHYRASMYMRPAAIWAMEMTASAEVEKYENEAGAPFLAFFARSGAFVSYGSLW